MATADGDADWDAGADALRRRRALVAVARGDRAPDLAVVGATIANVYSGEWLPWNVEVAGGRIAYVGPREPAGGPQTTVVDATGRTLVPGYIEPHFHPFSLYNPASALEFLLPSGTATTVSDNLSFFLAGGKQVFRNVVDAVRELPGHSYWVARVRSQSGYEGEDELFTLEAVRDQLRWPEVLGTGEVTRWVEISNGDPALLAAFAAARAAGKRVDGHGAGASFGRVAAMAAAGVSADHEAITGDEAMQRLRLGMWTLLRGSSLRRDLPGLIAAIRDHRADTRRVMLTTDGSGPLHVAEHGMLEGLLATVVDAGVAPMTALQMVTVNAATFLGLDEELGGLAPGRRATFSFLEAPDRFRPQEVYVDGRPVARDGELLEPPATLDWDALGCGIAFADPELFADPRLYLLPGDGAERVVATMRYESAVIARRSDRMLPVRDGVVDLAAAEGCAYMALVDRLGRWVSRGVVDGVFPHADGLATTYNTAAELLVIGRDPQSMSAAARRVAEMRGGVAFAHGGTVRWSAPLPVAGMSSAGSFADAVALERELAEQARAIGYPFHDVVYTLLFTVCDFLPDVRLTPRGLMEVKSGAILEPSERPQNAAA